MTVEPDDRERVLIIDDDPDVGKLLLAQIKATGRDARLTDDPAEFLRAHAEWRPAFVVIDLVMERMDGLEVLAHLARERSAAAVVITSGMGGRVLDAARRFADANGLTIAGVLGKPHTREEVREVFRPHAAAPPAAWEPTPLEPAAPLGATWRVAEFQADFRAALAGDELSVVYQPKVECASGAVVGYEALSRWAHPVRGAVPPDEFVPMAERFGLVSQLTDRVMREALRWFAGREHRAGAHLSINISAAEFDQPDFERRMLAACEDEGVDPSSVVLEMTETGAMTDAVGSLHLLTRLRLMGFHLSLDDFGTGFSSMLQLARLPFSELKVDRSFVMTAATSDESVIVIRSTIDLGHALGMHLTAEGVEDGAVLALLTELGCDYAQGYHIARPMSPEALDAWTATASI